jgi:raffinose/stachyose/melibiose transport system permease protein
MGNMKNRAKSFTNIRFTFNYLILALFIIFALGPIIILLFNSIKDNSEIGRNPLGIPKRVVLKNFPDAWRIGRFSTTARNSIILVIGTVSGELILAGMAAYSLSKLELPKKVPNILIMYFLIISSLPIQLFLIPLYVLWRVLGLVNNLLGVILIYIAIYSPLSIFLLRSYFILLPNDFRDSARVEGAGEFQVFTRIIIPLSWPAFLSVGLVISLYVWNEFIIATVFLTKTSLFTVVTSYYSFSQGYGRQWGLISAAAVMMSFPVIAIFLSLQRRFIHGLTQGGLKA